MAPARKGKPRRLTLSPASYVALARLCRSFLRPGQFWKSIGPELQEAFIRFEEEYNNGGDEGVPPPHVSPAACMHLRELKKTLGAAQFKKHIRAELRDSLLAGPHTRQAEQLLSDPVVVELRRRVERAKKGDLSAICESLERMPLLTLTDDLGFNREAQRLVEAECY